MFKITYPPQKAFSFFGKRLFFLFLLIGSACVRSSPPVRQETTPEPSLITEKENVRKKIVRIFLAGDVNFSKEISKSLQAGHNPFRFVQNVMREADLCIINLETTIATNGSPQVKTHVFRSPPEVLFFLTHAGVDVVSLANNHAMDYGAEAMFSMREHLQSYGLLFTGAGSNWQHAIHPIIITQKNISIGILCAGFQKPETLLATDTRPGTAGLRWKRIHPLIKKLKTQVDYLILFVHWGWEYTVTPLPKEQITNARLAIDAGADLIVGHHPHLIQGIEIYQGKPVFYSVGNYLFPQWEIALARAAFAVVVDLEKTNNLVNASYAIIPIYRLSNTLQPVIAAGESAQEVYMLVTNRSYPLGSNWSLIPQRKGWVPFWRIQF